eukprot:gene175-233_t
MEEARIIFMGTPTFAVPSLHALVKQDYRVVAVVTTPDQPQGRGRQVMPSPIKLAAEQHGIPVLQPENLQDPHFLADLDSYQANLYVVVAFRVLPQVVWSKPSWGTINLHASLLPQYRGAAPIHWAIMHGESMTGLTTFFIEKKIDTGHILLQEEEPIYAMDTVGTLSERLQHKGALLLVKTVEAIASRTYTVKEQPLTSATLKKAPKIYTKDCQISWDLPGEQVVNAIRGLSPHPGAWTILQGVHIKILAAHFLPVPISYPGNLCTDHKGYLHIEAQDGAVVITQLQPAGKKSMDVRSFLSGYKISR